jgi:hypothetical protein
MVRNVHIVITSVIVVTLFVLLIYPEIFPVNAPPQLHTLKDLFFAFAVVALARLFPLTALVNALFAGRQSLADPFDSDLSLFCVIRC